MSDMDNALARISNFDLASLKNDLYETKKRARRAEMRLKRQATKHQAQWGAERDAREAQWNAHLKAREAEWKATAAAHQAEWEAAVERVRAQRDNAWAAIESIDPDFFDPPTKCSRGDKGCGETPCVCGSNSITDDGAAR